MAVFPVVADVVGARSQESVLAIRHKVRTSYLSFSGTFEYKFNKLVETMAQGKLMDDYYVHNMRMVMLYFFEQCLYGKKPNTELK